MNVQMDGWMNVGGDAAEFFFLFFFKQHYDDYQARLDD